MWCFSNTGDYINKVKEKLCWRVVFWSELIFFSSPWRSFLEDKHVYLPVNQSAPSINCAVLFISDKHATLWALCLLMRESTNLQFSSGLSLFLFFFRFVSFFFSLLYLAYKYLSTVTSIIPTHARLKTVRSFTLYH